MRVRTEHAGHWTGHRAAGRAVSLLLLLLLLPSFALGEAATACFDPDTPPPYPAEHAPAGDDYFTDAVFIGDSMMEYMEMYDLLPTANFIWYIGMSPRSVGFRQIRVAGAEKLVSAYDAAAACQPRKIYVWLGANGLDVKPAKQVMEDYEKVADSLIARFPDALIYVISAPSMRVDRMAKEEYVEPGRYRLFESLLRDLAARRNFYYIDLYHLVTDESGYLPGKYAMGDGYHLNRDALTLLADCIRTHTVPYVENKGE